MEREKIHMERDVKRYERLQRHPSSFNAVRVVVQFSAVAAAAVAAAGQTGSVH